MTHKRSLCHSSPTVKLPGRNVHTSLAEPCAEIRCCQNSIYLCSCHKELLLLYFSLIERQVCSSAQPGSNRLWRCWEVRELRESDGLGLHGHRTETTASFRSKAQQARAFLLARSRVQMPLETPGPRGNRVHPSPLLPNPGQHLPSTHPCLPPSLPPSRLRWELCRCNRQPRRKHALHKGTSHTSNSRKIPAGNAGG